MSMTNGLRISFWPQLRLDTLYNCDKTVLMAEDKPVKKNFFQAKSTECTELDTLLWCVSASVNLFQHYSFSRRIISRTSCS